jgi:hypothetical protein
MRKVIFSAAPTSGGCIIAAITDRHGLALSRAGCPEGRWTTRGFHAEERLMDIAFCNGELYGLMRYRDCLVKFEIGLDEHGAPVLTAVHRLFFRLKARAEPGFKLMKPHHTTEGSRYNSHRYCER